MTCMYVTYMCMYVTYMCMYVPVVLIRRFCTCTYVHKNVGKRINCTLVGDSTMNIRTFVATHFLCSSLFFMVCKSIGCLTAL